jgi:hypothetical protein
MVRAMMRALFLCLMLCGCGMPGAYFAGLPAMRVAVDDVRFDVRTRGTLAEAWRVGPDLALRADPLFRPAQVAMEAASGCRVTRIGGDQVQFTGILRCPDRFVAPPLISAYACTHQREEIVCKNPRE